MLLREPKHAFEQRPVLDGTIPERGGESRGCGISFQPRLHETLQLGPGMMDEKRARPRFEVGIIGGFHGQFKQGLLSYDQSTKVSSALDGTSKTVIFFEDAGRNMQNGGKRSPVLGGNTGWFRVSGGQATAIVAGDGNWIDGTSGDMPVGEGTPIGTCPNRWCDPDNASGVSGAPWQESLIPRTTSIINNTKTPLGGSAATCLWSINNCGPNDEPFSMHAGGGCFAGLADGSVTWLGDDLDCQVLRQLSDPADGEAALQY